MESNKQGRLKALLRRMVDGIVQDVPPELDVCEMCRKPRCSQKEWIVCENRIFHLECLKAHENKTSVPGRVLNRLAKRAEARRQRTIKTKPDRQRSK